MKPGEPFNPKDLYLSTKGKTYPPAILTRQKGTPDNLKLLYWRLYSHFGMNSAAWPGIETLAAEIGKSKRQVQYDIEALAKAKLIRVEPRTVGPRRRGNRYRVLWHPMFDQVQSVAPGDAQDGAHEVQLGPDEVQTNVENDLTRCNALPRNSFIGLNSPKENSPKENASSFEGEKPKPKQEQVGKLRRTPSGAMQFTPFLCACCEDKGVVVGSYPAQACSCAAGQVVGPKFLEHFYGKNGRPKGPVGATRGLEVVV